MLNKVYLSEKITYLFKKYKHIGTWRPGSSKTEIIISTVLTQMCQRKQVEILLKKLQNLKFIPYKNIIKYSNIYIQVFSERDYINKIINNLKIDNLEGIGFKTRKYKTIICLLKYISKANLFKNIETLRQELLTINGIGYETVDSILCYGLDKKIFVVDNYTYKVLEIDKKIIKYNELRIEIESLLKKGGLFDICSLKNLHGAFVEEGKKFKN